MRRNCRGSSFRVATAFTHRVGPAMISVALLLCTPGLAKADPDTTAKLIADVAQANQRLQDLNAQIQTEEESVNKAVVDVETARDNATAAQHDVEASQQIGQRTPTPQSRSAQKRFDRFAVASYVNGPSDGYLTAASPDDMIATAAAGQAAGRQLAAGDGQPATGPHRAVEQGFVGPAGQAEGRQGRRRRAVQPERGGGRP